LKIVPPSTGLAQSSALLAWVCTRMPPRLNPFAISMERDRWEAAKARLDEAGVEYLLESGSSMYFRDPDGARVELISDPLGEMYGSKVICTRAPRGRSRAPAPLH
jgi:catechol 2,3-dioxygenase-like lactoylglutathione lyase family enzyme